MPWSSRCCASRSNCAAGEGSSLEFEQALEIFGDGMEPGVLKGGRATPFDNRGLVPAGPPGSLPDDPVTCCLMVWTSRDFPSPGRPRSARFVPCPPEPAPSDPPAGSLPCHARSTESARSGGRFRHNARERLVRLGRGLISAGNFSWFHRLARNRAQYR